MTLSTADAVRITGMKAREIVDLIPVPEGTVIQTHDGQRMLWDGATVAPYRRPDIADTAAAVDVDGELATLRADNTQLHAELERLTAENAELTRLLDAATAGGAGGNDDSGDDQGEQGEPDVDVLRVQAEALGIKVDKRWGAERLRQEIARKAGD
jgi:hypothetical protein